MPTEGSGPDFNGPKGDPADTSAGAANGDPCPEGDGVKNLAQVMRLLCEETRLRILFTLAEGERDVTGLWAPMGLPQATVSHHLTFLRLAGLVSTRREGKHIHYRLGPGARVTSPGVLSVDCPSYGLRMEVRQPTFVASRPDARRGE
jgi:DNA-binding transcriptional ArsR family regulator